MAIEKVYILANDQLIAEEVLAHRLGLIPIKADPRLFQFKDADDDPTDLNTIVFNLDVTCSENKKNKDHVLMDDRFFHHKVFSGDLKWHPQVLLQKIFIFSGNTRGEISKWNINCRFRYSTYKDEAKTRNQVNCSLCKR